MKLVEVLTHGALELGFSCNVLIWSTILIPISVFPVWLASRCLMGVEIRQTIRMLRATTNALYEAEVPPLTPANSSKATVCALQSTSLSQGLTASCKKQDDVQWTRHSTSTNFVIFVLLSDFWYMLLPDKLLIKERAISWGTRITGTWVLVLHNTAESPPAKGWLLGFKWLHSKINFRADFFSTDCFYSLSTSTYFSLLRNINRRKERGRFSWGNFPSVCMTSATLKFMGESNRKVDQFQEITLATSEELFKWLCNFTKLQSETSLTWMWLSIF